MSSYNVTMTVGGASRQQVLVDEQALAQLQAEIGRRGAELERLKAAMETLSAVNTPARFIAAAMALVNELASRWQAERVGIGFLRGRYVRLAALSHTEKITRHMQLVQDIEAAMEECLDQDLEILFPAAADSSYVCRATQELSTRHGQNAVCSLPLRRDGGVVAVLTLERKVDRPLAAGDVETLRLTCDLFTARLADLYEQDRWIGAKAAKATRNGMAWIVGAKHTWPKVAALAVLGVTGFSLLVHGDYKIEAPFVFEATEKQILSAPFDGRLETVNVEPGDRVLSEATSGKIDALDRSPLIPLFPRRPVLVLATLNTYELRDRLISAKAEHLSNTQQANIARKEGITREAEVQMYLAQAQKAQAQMDLLEWQIAQASVKSPIDGIVFSGDLKPKIGVQLKVGEELFEVGDQALLRAELSVPEDQITELAVKQTGELATTSYPGAKIHFTVERLDPVATVVGQHNVYKVRVKLDPADTQLWTRPGMEGVAKVQVGRERYAWLWTHRLVNWIRMKLWV